MTGTPINFKACALALGAILTIGGAGLAHSTPDTAVSGCEVLANPMGGSFALEAVYHAEQAVNGSYQFSVKSAGGANRTNINQGGGFTAKSSETLTLGRVTVGGAAAYDVTLKIDAGGKSVECGGRVNLSA